MRSDLELVMLDHQSVVLLADRFCLLLHRIAIDAILDQFLFGQRQLIPQFLDQCFLFFKLLVSFILFVQRVSALSLRARQLIHQLS